MLSRWVDWNDRATCVLFGDGAGAIVLEASTENHLLGFELRTDGTQNACLNLGYRGSARPLTENILISQGTYQPVTMNGKEVYRFAVQQVPEVLEKALFRAGLPLRKWTGFCCTKPINASSMRWQNAYKFRRQRYSAI